MFNIGEYVQNQKTKHIGKVIGYGHEILNEGYTTTLKVLVDYAFTPDQHEIIEEDIYSVWVRWVNP